MRSASCKNATINFLTCEHMCSLDNMVASEEKCNECENYASRFIEFPITVDNIEVKNDDLDMYASYIGKQCELRLGDETETRIGIILGELPYAPLVNYNKKDKIINVAVYKNVAIYVPDLKRVVYGCECWWRKLDDEKE